ncbi:MAG: CoA ester lyase [Neisseria sp.]|nr:CoA ester lyase [Neisseria sp.]
MQKTTGDIWLFVPGTRPDLLDKTFGCGADAPVIDWEDTVAAEMKSEVRRQTVRRLDGEQRPVWLRINGEESGFFADDLKVLGQISSLAGVFLPKVQTASGVEAAAEACGKPVIAMIEDSRAWLGLADIAAAEGLSALTYGCLDLLAQVGADRESEAGRMLLDRLRADLVLHSAAKGLHPPVEGIYPELKNDEGYREYLQFGRDLGFRGTLCLHPRQVAVARDVQQGSDGRLLFAARVLAEYERAGGEVFALDGKMIDKPVIEEARRLLQSV